MTNTFNYDYNRKLSKLVKWLPIVIGFLKVFLGLIKFSFYNDRFAYTLIKF